MKQKTTDEKVYATLCQIFDEFHDEFTEQIPCGTLDSILENIKYAEDYDRNKVNRDVWFDMINDWRLVLSDEFKNKHMKWITLKPWYIVFNSKGRKEKMCDSFSEEEITELSLVVKVDNFKFSFLLKDLPHYICIFHKLSKHRGKHPIPKDKPLNERGQYWQRRNIERAKADVSTLMAAL